MKSWRAAGCGLLMGVALSARADDLLGVYQEALLSVALFLAAQAMELEYRLEYTRDALQSIVARPLTPLASLNPDRLQLTRPDPERLEEWIRMAE